MRKYTQKHKRGYIPPEDVKSERFTLTFTQADYDRLAAILDEMGVERMEYCREAIMKRVQEDETKKGIPPPPPTTAPAQRNTSRRGTAYEPLTLRQQADILGYRNQLTVKEIATRVGVSEEAVQKFLEEP